MQLNQRLQSQVTRLPEDGKHRDKQTQAAKLQELFF